MYWHTLPSKHKPKRLPNVPNVTNDQCSFYPATALPPSPSFPISPTSPPPQPQPQSHKAAIEESTQNPSLGTSIVPYSKASGHNMGTVSPARSLNDPASILVEFYFKETAQLFSCYDSSMNPFRTTVSRQWNSSPLLYKTLSFMAAASLVNDFPQLTALKRGSTRGHIVDRTAVPNQRGTTNGRLRRQ
jgi:hypothetical protein